MSDQATQNIMNKFKHTEIGDIPEDWDILTLKEVSKYRRGSFPQPYGLEKWYDNNYGLPFIQVFDVDNNFKLKSETKRKISDKAQKMSVFVKKGSIVLTLQGSIGRIAITQYDAYVDRTLLLFESFLVPTDNYYFAYSVFVLFEKEKQSAPGGIIKTITKERLSDFMIPFPPIEEQIKISSLLFNMDSLIENLEKLIVKKKNIKQGAMQELLTGKRRLPGFSGEWEKKKLGEICEIKKGQLITEKTKIDGNIPVIAGGKTPAYFHNRANRSNGAITISASGANAGYIALFEEPIFASDCSTIEKSKCYSIKFIYYQLLLNQEGIYKMQTGGAQPHIHSGDLYPLVFFNPKENEQTAIATILADMDLEIELLEKNLEKYKQIKQGTMQVLLTGKIRLINN